MQSGKNAADPAETIETIYNKIVYFKHHNMFTPLQGTTTEMMTREMTRIIEEYNNDASGKAMAMKLLMIMPKLLLQKEHMKAKKKENDKAFRRRMEAWQKGEYLELMEEAEAIQKRLRQQPRGETEEMIARKFRTRMEEGNVHQAARLLQPQQGGLLQINKETTEKLKAKHPAGTRATQEALLSGEIEAPHQVTFRSINQEMVRKAAMETKGSPGPSGMTDANTWRMLITSKRNSMAAADLCKAVAKLAQKMGHKNCRLIPLKNQKNDVRPIGIGEVLRRIISKCIMKTAREDTMKAVGNLQLCAGQQAGAEAAVHAAKEIFTDKECEAVLLIDASNAFNTLNRQAMMHNISVLCPTLATYVKKHIRNSSKIICCQRFRAQIKRRHYPRRSYCNGSI